MVRGAGIVSAMFKPLRIVALAAVFARLTAGAQETKPEESRYLANARQLIFEGKRSGEGYFHPDGNLLVFQSEREEANPFYQIYLLDLLSGESARVSPGTGKTTCAFFQPSSTGSKSAPGSGGRLLFSSTYLDPEAVAKQKAELDFRASGKQRRYSWDYDGAMDIFSCQQDGTELQQLTTEPGYDAEASFSPDGKKIVFTSLRGAYPLSTLPQEQQARFEKDPAYFGDIWMMNADGSDPHQLTHAPGYDGGPFFSPDGERIVWRRFDESGMNADIFTMKTDGSDVRRVTDFKSMSWAPFYHPSGQYLIFTSNKLGFENFELFMVDVNGEREPVRVTTTEGFDGLPVFSPDGKRLSWTSNRTVDNKSQLFLADWNHPAALQALQEAPVRVLGAEQAQAVERQRGTALAERESRVSALTPLPEKGPLQIVEGGAKLSPEITGADMRAEVEWLASPEREGRQTGSAGAKATAEFAADYFAQIGLQPFGTGFAEPFTFPAGEQVMAGANSLIITTHKARGPEDAPPGAPGSGGIPLSAVCQLDQSFRPLSFTENGEIEGEVVFAGYGLSAPEDGKGARYNSYEGLDVKDKVVLVLRYVPESVSPERRAQLNRYAGLRYKAMMARERGAKAVLFVAGPASPQAGELLPLAGDNTAAGSGILAASVTGDVADTLLKPSGKSLKDLQAALDTESPHAEGGFVLPDAHVQLATGVEHIKKEDRNVVALLPAGVAGEGISTADHADGTDGKTADAALAGTGSAVPILSAASAQSAIQNSGGEVIIVGAHYDHLGLGKGSNSMARSGEEGQVHPGADDNGSGVAAVLELAASLAKERAEHPEKFRRGIVFALWSGEEMGIIGSSSFCEKPPVDLGKVAAYVNFDMVGRLRENKLTLQGVGSSKAWRRLIEKRNVTAGFNLVLQDDPYLPTDTTSFYPKRIPVLNFFTGAHEDYHRPSDTADKLNYEGAERIAKFARQLVLDLSSAPERPDFARVEKSSGDQGSRETLRAYLGTIPDYTAEVQGVKLAGVRGGSPAEKAGIQGGDVLVEFAGQKIVNIYDYTYGLDAVKIGQPVKIAVQRDGKRVELEVTPDARK